MRAKNMVLSLIFLSLFLATFAVAQQHQNPASIVVPGQFIVRLSSEPVNEIPGLNFSIISAERKLYRVTTENVSISAATIQSQLEAAGLAVVRIEPNSVYETPNLPSSKSRMVAGNYVGAEALPLHVKSLKVKGLQEGAKFASVYKIVVLDSGINPSLLSAGNTLDMQNSLSMFSFGFSPAEDTYGHGKYVAMGIDAVDPKGTVFRSIQIFSGRPFTLSNGKTVFLNYFTDETLLRGFETIRQQAKNSRLIVNGSFGLGKFLSEEIDQMIKETKNSVLWVFSAGNYNLPRAENPCGRAREFANIVCPTSQELTGYKSNYSNYGTTTEVAGFGTLSAAVYGTSFATANAVGIASLLTKLGLDPSPRLLKKLLLMGEQNPKLKGLVGDPLRWIDGISLSGEGSFAALKRLQSVQAINTYPATVTPGDMVTLSVTEDPQWLTRFDKAEAFGTSFSLRLTNASGEKMSIPVFITGRGLEFTAPAVGEYQLSWVTDGSIVSKNIPLIIGKVPELIVHLDGSAVTAEAPLAQGTQFVVTIRASEGATIELLLPRSDGEWHTATLNQVGSDPSLLGYRRLLMELPTEAPLLTGEVQAYVAVTVGGKTTLIAVTISIESIE